MTGLLAAERKRGIKEARKLLKESTLAMHVGSVALGLEALEAVLVDKGVIKENELMERLEKMAREKVGQ